MYKPVELEIELFCRGMRIDTSCEGARRISRTRAGLGSGLEIVIPAKRKDIWMNVPVVESFAKQSPFILRHHDGSYHVLDRRDAIEYEVTIPDEPEWYAKLSTT